MTSDEIMHVNFATDKKFRFDLKELKDFRLNRFNMLIIASVILAVMIVFAITQKFRLDGYQGDVSSMEREIAKLQKQAATGGVTGITASRGAVLNGFEKRVDWGKTFLALTNSFPRSIFVSAIRGITDKDRLVEINGTTADQSGVVDMTNGLSGCGACASVKLQSSETAKKDDNTFLNFTVVCTLKR